MSDTEPLPRAARQSDAELAARAAYRHELTELIRAAATELNDQDDTGPWWVGPGVGPGETVAGVWDRVILARVGLASALPEVPR